MQVESAESSGEITRWFAFVCMMEWIYLRDRQGDVPAGRGSEGDFGDQGLFKHYKHEGAKGFSPHPLLSLKKFKHPTS